MDIIKRSSGGRGEYEIAGQHGSLSPQDLQGHELVIELGGQYGQLRTGITLVEQGGKCRLRISGGAPQIHIHRQLESILLMPKSIRDEDQLVGGQPVILENRYVLRSIELKAITKTGIDALVTLGRVECDNRSQVEEIDFGQRLAIIQQLHEKAGKFPVAIHDFLEEHRETISAQKPLTTVAELIVSNLMKSLEDVSADYNKDYAAGWDPLPFLRELIVLPQIEKPPQIESIDPQDVELRRREATKWRQYVAARGAPGAKFRHEVIKAYDSTCVVCGIRLPKSEACRVPGVDAAHILPWADYDLDIVGNGLCLCKLHHWAFDQMLISIVHENSGYRVSVTELAALALQEGTAAMSQLKSHAGPISKDRLPKDQANWPSKQFLEKLQEDMELKA